MRPGSKFKVDLEEVKQERTPAVCVFKQAFS